MKKFWGSPTATGETSHGSGTTPELKPGTVGIPMYVYPGRVPNPHVVYGQDDMLNATTTFARIATRWGDVQLSNGYDRTNYGKRFVYKGAGYLNVVMPSVPGQTRQSGSLPGNFPVKGMAPSQWDAHVQLTAGAQPNYPGGPGQAYGTTFNPGSGA